MKTRTLKIKNKKNNKVIMVYNTPLYEDKGSLELMLLNAIQKGIKVGQKIEAWKFYDTSCSYRFAKAIGSNTYHFQAC